MSHFLFCHDQLVAELDLPVTIASGDGWGLDFRRKPPFELSPHLPYEAGLDKTVIRHFFVNYLPESPYAERVAARFTPRPQTDAQLLACLGYELAGAFSVEESANQNVRSKRVDGYDSLAFSAVEEAVRDSRDRADAVAFQSQLARLSLAGAQDKFALWFNPKAADSNARFKLPKGRAASTHIFKPSSTDTRYPFLPANEYACAMMARILGLRTADTDILTLGGVRTLVTKRFDRRSASPASESVSRLHQIDLCQLLNRPREAKYGSEGGIDMADFFSASKHLAIPALARQDLLRSWLFNFLIGNHDAHAKNFSFGYLQKKWHLAPLYDLLCVTPYLPNQPLAMGLLHEYRPGWFERTHWLALAKLAGVTPSYLSSSILHLLDELPNASVRLAALLRQKLTHEELNFLSERINPIIQLRAQWLSDAIQHLRSV
jgi:serine/threonine-protein kinase HipA